MSEEVEMFGILRRVEMGITTVRDARRLAVWLAVLPSAGFLLGWLLRGVLR